MDAITLHFCVTFAFAKVREEILCKQTHVIREFRQREQKKATTLKMCLFIYILDKGENNLSVYRI